MAAWLIYSISPQLYGFLKSVSSLSHVNKKETQLSISDKRVTIKIFGEEDTNEKEPHIYLGL